MTDYTVIRSHRRTMALEVTREGAALVRAPYAASDAAIAVSYTHLTLPTNLFV